MDTPRAAHCATSAAIWVGVIGKCDDWARVGTMPVGAKLTINGLAGKAVLESADMEWVQSKTVNKKIG
jgi:hypothetical protein